MAKILVNPSIKLNGVEAASSYVADEILDVIDRAEDFFDALVIRGHSKTEKTKSGKPKLVEINLLTERLHEVADLPAAGTATNLPDPTETVKSLNRTRRKMRDDGRLGQALEARIGPGAS